jgi:hypothetical protein
LFVYFHFWFLRQTLHFFSIFMWLKYQPQHSSGFAKIIRNRKCFLVATVEPILQRGLCSCCNSFSYSSLKNLTLEYSNWIYNVAYDIIDIPISFHLKNRIYWRPDLCGGVQYTGSVLHKCTKMYMIKYK